MVLSLWEKTSAVRERRQSALVWLRNWATPALEWSWSGLPAWAWGKGAECGVWGCLVWGWRVKGEL